MNLDFVYKIYSGIFVATVPVLHPVRSARGSSFFIDPAVPLRTSNRDSHG